MGRLLYGDSARAIEFDDRTLIHVHLVINAKLRRREGFFFSWKDDPAAGSGRSSIWLECSIPLYFKFTTNVRHTINREWLEMLTVSANQPQGMLLVPEPIAAPPAPAPLVHAAYATPKGRR
jgi:hypothetical protein